MFRDHSGFAQLQRGGLIAGRDMPERLAVTADQIDLVGVKVSSSNRFQSGLGKDLT